MARGGRQFRSDAMDYSRGEVEVEARASASVRPWCVTEGCYAAAAGVAGRGERKAATERCLDESDEKISCFSRFFSAETGYEQVETGGGLPMAEPVVCEESREDGDADGFHALGIHPDFQRFMQFDLQGDLLQCSAVPFGWNDAPRVFCKFVRVMVEALCSPQAAEDRKEIKRLRDVPQYDSDGQSVAEQVVLARTRTVTAECEYYCTWAIFWCWSTLREKAFCVEKKFNRRLASFTGLCQSVYLAVPAARLYLRELYFVLAEKRSWGAKVKISRAAPGDLEWWSRLPDEQVERAQDLAIPDESEDEMRNWHITHLELEAVYKTVQAFLKELEGKVVRLYCDNQAVVAMLSHFTSRNPDLMRRMRRLWLLLDLHDIELQARYIRGEANMWADNLSRCEDLDDWRLNRDWFVWANKQWGPYTVDRFASEISAQLPRYYAAWKDPRCEGVDSLTYDWRGENNWVNRPWALLDEVAHKLREEGAAATGLIHSEQAGRVRAARALKVGRCDVLHRGAPVSYYAAEVRRSSASCTTAAEVTVGSKIEVFWKDDDCFYPGVVKEFNEDGKAHVLYDDGDEETLDLSEENFKIINSVSELTDEAADADGENIENSGGDYEENKRGGVVQNFLTRSLC
ncbi:hypothetical protein CYMTET_31407 [Cymbomonas tetramitiformis]|uniref:Tudor domain-containing protein n=1 Tax=Cymbomonas tetramitiformis TaxID=36881 RepID=A0AAE0FH94_9CHLO|nr:hypothetical protein CYMTET_31407 [Cymbomonas tetramitiformis]